MEIRKSTEADVSRMMEIFAHARQFMAEHGNPSQWGPRNWPPESLIRQDIAEGNSYVCIDEGRIVGTFFFIFGKNVEPTYATITGGTWLDDSPYGVIHRIASDGTKKGVGKCCICWALQQCPHLRVDTHEDNKVVQNLLKKLGFVHCGTIYLEEDHTPRLAFELTLSDNDAMLDTKKMDEYSAQAKASWCNTEAYREYERKSEGRSDEENRLLSGQMMDIFAEFGRIRGSDPASDAAQALVKKLQGFISEHYYTCTKDILRGLGQMYAGGGDMTVNIDRFGGVGTAAFAAEAIRFYCI